MHTLSCEQVFGAVAGDGDEISGFCLFYRISRFYLVSLSFSFVFLLFVDNNWKTHHRKDYNLRSRKTGRALNSAAASDSAQPPLYTDRAKSTRPVYSDHSSRRGTESDSNSMADDETRSNDYDSDLEYEDFNPRTMRDFNVPRVGDVRGAIRLPRIVGGQPNFNSGVVNMIQQNLFYGMDHEDPHAHIQSFLGYCTTIRANGATTDYIRLAMFPFTLRDKAKKWLGSLPRGSIGTWKNLSKLFLTRFFPHRRTT